MYATTPGFQHLQQSALALHAKRHGFTLLLPTAPLTPGGYVWPGTAEAIKDSEAAIVASIKQSKAELERRAGKPFDETFIAGFSSGAYYASSLAVRGTIDVDGYMVFCGGASWQKPEEGTKRAPVFVGVSAADGQTASHSRAFAGHLAALKWPFKVEERNAPHTVDWTLLAHGLGWLRAQTGKSKS
jgi:predicted esterase